MQWPEGFWQGAGGVLLGTAASVVIALAVMLLTQRHERALLRERISLDAAWEAWTLLSTLVRRTDKLMGTGQDWHDVEDLISACRVTAERLYGLHLQVRPERLDWDMAHLWEELQDQFPDRLRAAIRRNDTEKADRLASEIGTWCTNVMDELEFYLRSRNVKRRWWHRLRVTRREGFPWLRRRTLTTDLRDLAEGQEPTAPKRDY